MPAADSVRVKELENRVDQLQSELEVKSKAMEGLRNEKKSLINKYTQLKEKDSLKEKDLTFSQPIMLDSLEDDPEV